MSRRACLITTSFFNWMTTLISVSISAWADHDKENPCSSSDLSDSSGLEWGAFSVLLFSILCDGLTGVIQHWLKDKPDDRHYRVLDNAAEVVIQQVPQVFQQAPVQDDELQEAQNAPQQVLRAAAPIGGAMSLGTTLACIGFFAVPCYTIGSILRGLAPVVSTIGIELHSQALEWQREEDREQGVLGNSSRTRSG